MKLAFIGLGNMGSGMARNLLRAGHQLTVYNRSKKRAEALAGEGAKVANSAIEACRDCEAVFTMLSDDAAVTEIVFGENGIASTLKKNSVHISSSTISTALARRLATEHAARGECFVSAPVFGRPEAAEGKKLLILAAGEHDVVERCRPLLDAMGRRTVVVGSETWQANAVKLCGNFMIASMLETFGEAFATVRKAEIDRQVFIEVIGDLFASPLYKNYMGIVADERFDPAAFALPLGLKDIRLVIEAAEELAAPMPLASLIRNQLVSAVAHGQQDLDWSSVTRVAARNAGLES